MPALAVHRPQRCLCSGWHVLTAGAPPHRQAARSYGRYVSASGARAARYLPRGTLQCVCTTHDPHRAERCRWKAVTAWLLVEDVRLGRARGGWTRLGAAAPPPAAGASMARTTHWLSVWAGTGSTGGHLPGGGLHYSRAPCTGAAREPTQGRLPRGALLSNASAAQVFHAQAY